MKQVLFFLVNYLFIATINAQSVGIGTTTPNSSAVLDVRSSSKGLLIPTMTVAQRNAISNPATGLMVFQTDGTAGFYYNSGPPATPAWTQLGGGGSGSGWQLSGNSATNPATHFIGTTDDVALRFKINNKNAGFVDSLSSTTSFGYRALDSVVYGRFNTAFGYSALRFNKYGLWNTAFGYNALTSHTGSGNTAVGYIALSSNTVGENNTAIGFRALLANTTGSSNTANGSNSLVSNTSGSYNTAGGEGSLLSNTIGNYNTSIGGFSLRLNTSGSNNTAVGYNTLHSNTTGNLNTASGQSALYSNTTGSYNTASGYYSLYYNYTGSNSTAIGYNAGPNYGWNPSNYTAIGYGAGKIGNNSNTIEIGNNSITWIGGQVGWSTYSDERIKENIQSNVPGLAFISKLRPVTYQLNLQQQNRLAVIQDTLQWEGKYDIEKITQTGFLAQEVEQAAKELNFDFSGVTTPKGNSKLYSLQYASFVVPLVKSVQEQQEQIELLRNENTELKKRLEKLEALLLK